MDSITIVYKGDGAEACTDALQNLVGYTCGILPDFDYEQDLPHGKEAFPRDVRVISVPVDAKWYGTIEVQDLDETYNLLPGSTPYRVVLGRIVVY